MFSFLDSCLKIVDSRFTYVVLRLYLEETRCKKLLKNNCQPLGTTISNFSTYSIILGMKWQLLSTIGNYWQVGKVIIMTVADANDRQVAILFAPLFDL